VVLETLVAPTVWSGLAVVSVGEPMGQPVTARVLEEMPCGFACPLASSWLRITRLLITILGMQGQLSCDNSSGTACGGMARR
jgi:hypothetical protein